MFNFYSLYVLVVEILLIMRGKKFEKKIESTNCGFGGKLNHAKI